VLNAWPIGEPDGPEGTLVSVITYCLEPLRNICAEGTALTLDPVCAPSAEASLP